MNLNPRFIIFPISREEFDSIPQFEDFLINTVTSVQRNGIYHIRTKLKYPPMGSVPVGSIAVFRFFGQHLGHAQVKVGLRKQFEPERFDLYPYYITFEPSTIELFPRKILLSEFRRIYPHPFFTRAYIDMTRSEYHKLVQLAGVRPII